MNPTLHTFYNNENEREAVKAFMIESLKEMAVDRTFEGRDVKGIQECRELVDVIFDKLATVYGKIDKPLPNNSR